MQIASFWPATCTHMAQESGGPLSVTLEARQLVYVNGEREKSGARLDCFCFGIHGGMPADSVSGEHSRPKSASPPSQPPVFPGLLYGRGGEIATNRVEDQEITVLALHLLQVSLVYINTLMIQRVLSESAWADRMTAEDKRGLTPLVWGHVNPHGLFLLDMNTRLAIETAEVVAN